MLGNAALPLPRGARPSKPRRRSRAARRRARLCGWGRRWRLRWPRGRRLRWFRRQRRVLQQLQGDWLATPPLSIGSPTVANTMGMVRVCCSSAHAKHDAHDQQASSCFRVGLTRLVNEQDIRTPQHIKNRARNDPGILATDIKSVSRGLSSMRVMCLETASEISLFRCVSFGIGRLPGVYTFAFSFY